MDTARLLDVLSDIQFDYTKWTVAERLTALISVTGRMASNQAQPPEFNQARAALSAGLAQARSNSFSPSRQEILNRLGGADLTGLGLERQVQRVLDENRSVHHALTRLQDLNQRVVTFHAALVQVAKSLAQFEGLGNRAGAGEFELGLHFPDSSLEEGLGGLQQALREWSMHLENIVELSTGERRTPRIVSAGGGSLWLFLATSATAATAIGGGVLGILEAYKKILEIRKLRGDLKRNGMPAEVLQAVEGVESRRLEEAIDAAAGSVASASPLADVGRKNELTVAVRRAFRFVATAAGKGIIIEISASRDVELRRDALAVDTAEHRAVNLCVQVAELQRTLGPPTDLPQIAEVPQDLPHAGRLDG